MQTDVHTHTHTHTHTYTYANAIKGLNNTTRKHIVYTVCTNKTLKGPKKRDMNQEPSPLALAHMSHFDSLSELELD